MGNEQLSQLGFKIQALEKMVRHLDSRLAVLEGGPVEIVEAPVLVDKGEDLGLGISSSRFMFLLGRAILILAGGFLLRALAGGGGLPSSVGFGLGMAYSLGLTFLVFRFFHGGDRFGAGRTCRYCPDTLFFVGH